ncbi:MAG: hypothetical protein FJ225_01755 [Lentisphaerae bacterium]|nr:hypothetical protein [Lentisphaerota bacterium]
MSGAPDERRAHAGGPEKRAPGPAARLWFTLTAEEQTAALIVLGLLIVGMAVRAWRGRAEWRAAERTAASAEVSRNAAAAGRPRAAPEGQ